jgi:hypothetical protein
MRVSSYRYHESAAEEKGKRKVINGKINPEDDVGRKNSQILTLISRLRQPPVTA